MVNGKIRILHITADLDGGGVDRLLYDYFLRLKNDITFDFILTGKKVGILEKSLLELGCRITHVPQLHENIFGYIRSVTQVLKSAEYDIVQVHSGYKAFLPLFLTKTQHVKVRIAHSHQAYVPQKIQLRLMRRFFTSLTKATATDLFACGRDAAVWMWGENTYKRQKVYIMHNCIETERFRFSASERERVRKELKLEDYLVFGCVARFSWQKNHEFLLDVFQCIHQKRQDAVLLLIGGGELEDQIHQKTRDMDLMDAVRFLGVRNDVHLLLNAMDCFLLPSRFEGLPVTLVEIQANGLKAYVSDSITDEIRISNSLTFLSLENSPEKWAQDILQTNDFHRQENAIDSVTLNGYGLEAEAQKLLQKYRRLCSNEIRM